MQHIPTDVLHSVLSLCGEQELQAAEAICHEWRSAVHHPCAAESPSGPDPAHANHASAAASVSPSTTHTSTHTDQSLWSLLAAHRWSHAHRIHAAIQTPASGMRDDNADDIDASKQKQELKGLDEEEGEAERTPLTSSSPPTLSSSLHCDPPPIPVICPFLHPSIGYRELLHYTTDYPTHIDSSNPAVFSQVSGDIHEMVALGPLNVSRLMKIRSAALRKGEAEARRMAMRRMGRRPMGEYRADEEDEAMMVDGEVERDDVENENDVDEFSAESLADLSLFLTRLRARLASELREHVDMQRRANRILEQRNERRRLREEAAQRRRASQTSTDVTPTVNSTSQANSSVNPSSGDAATPAAAASSPPTSISIMAAIAEAATGAPSSSPDSPHRPNVRSRSRSLVRGHGPTPSTMIEIAATVTRTDTDTHTDTHANTNADQAGRHPPTMQDDEEVWVDDGDDEMLDDELDEDYELDENDDFDEDDWDEDELSSSSSDDDAMDEDRGVVSDSEDMASRMPRLFHRIIDEASALNTSADIDRAIASALASDEATAIFQEMRQRALNHQAAVSRKQQRKLARLLHESHFELGTLTNSRSASSDWVGSYSVESKTDEEVHLQSFRYSGNVTGSDRSVRADCLFPTCLPKHCMPFTNFCWVEKSKLDKMKIEADALRKQSDLIAQTKFEAASKVLQREQQHEAASPHSNVKTSSPKRKLEGLHTAEEEEGKKYSRTDADESMSHDTSTSSTAANPNPLSDFFASTSTSTSASAFSSSPQPSPPPSFVPVTRLSFLAYFEIIITEDPKIRRARRTGQLDASGSSNCVAIGLGTERFKLIGRQPGWDAHSFGWHSDDGCLFHGSGSSSQPYPEGGGGFGVNDIVGCGMNYLSGEIFFTKNGRHLGRAFGPNIVGTFYPIVGIDALWAVDVNFGDSMPFAFDVLGYERVVMLNMPPPLRIIDHTADLAKQLSGENEGEGEGEGTDTSNETTHHISTSRKPVLQLLDNYRTFIQKKKEWRAWQPPTTPAHASSASTSAL